MRSALLVGSAVLICVVVAHQARSIGPGLYNDLLADYASARALVEGGDPYGPTLQLLADHDEPPPEASSLHVPEGQVNPHPPASVLLSAPLGLSSWTSARWLWLVTSAAAVVGAGNLLARGLMRVRRGADAAVAVALGALVLVLPAVQKNLLYGQMGPLLLLLLVAAWHSIRHGHDRRAGILLGAMAALKLFPLIAVIPLMRRRRWVAIRAQLTTFVLATSAGALLLGVTPAGYQEAAEANFSSWGTAPNNLSLVAMPVRALTDDVWFAGPHHPFAASVLALLVGLMVLGGLWWVAPTRACDGLLHWMAGSLVVTPLFWDHYLIIVIPLWAISMRAAFDQQRLGLGLALASLGIWTLTVSGRLFVVTDSVAANSAALMGLLLMFGANRQLWSEQPSFGHPRAVSPSAEVALP